MRARDCVISVRAGTNAFLLYQPGTLRRGSHPRCLPLSCDSTYAARRKPAATQRPTITMIHTTDQSTASERASTTATAPFGVTTPPAVSTAYFRSHQSNQTNQNTDNTRPIRCQPRMPRCSAAPLLLLKQPAVLACLEYYDQITNSIQVTQLMERPMSTT